MIFASNNKGKLIEIKSIFNEEEIKSLKDAKIEIEIIEDQDSFYGNALKKARGIYNLTKVPVIADDSGLCINVLNDWPGVITQRFLREEATDKERNDAIIKKMEQFKHCEREAKVICNLVYYDGINIITGEGILKGKISQEPRGSNGFGFDEIFELKDGRTLAELSSEEKNKISARYLAAVDLKEKLKNIKRTR